MLVSYDAGSVVTLRLTLAVQGAGSVAVSLFNGESSAAIVKTLSIGLIANMSCCASNAGASRPSTGRPQRYSEYFDICIYMYRVCV